MIYHYTFMNPIKLIDDCECGKPCKTFDGNIGLCQKDKTCSGMMDSLGGIGSGMGGFPDCKPDGPHTGKPHTGKPHTGRPPTGKPPTDGTIAYSTNSIFIQCVIFFIIQKKSIFDLVFI